MKHIYLFCALLVFFGCEQQVPDCNNINCQTFDPGFDYAFPIAYDLRNADTVTYTYSDSLNTETFTLTAFDTDTTFNTLFNRNRCDNQIALCNNAYYVTIQKTQNGVTNPKFAYITYQKCVSCPKNFYMYWDDTTQYVIETHLNALSSAPSLPDSVLRLTSPNCKASGCNVFYYAKSLPTSWATLTDSVLIKNYNSFYYLELERPFVRSEQRIGIKGVIPFDSTSKPFLYLSTQHGIICFGDLKKKTKYYLRKP